MAAKRPVCKYGDECYRKNPDHLKNYYHPPKVEEDAKVKLKQTTLQLATDKADKAKLSAESTDNSSGVGSKGDNDIKVTCTDLQKTIKEKFLVDMPQDFYDFWEFCKHLNPATPEDALKEYVGLRLVGPYLVLAGQLSKSSWKDCVLQSRYFYDTPEVQTVLESATKSGYHIGYFRDDPVDLPVFLISNNHKESCVIKVEADNIFAAVGLQVTKKLKTGSVTTKLNDFNKKLIAKCNELGYSMGESKNYKARNKKVVGRCFNKIGIVVPVDVNDVGYRPLPMTNSELKKTLDKIVSSKSESEKAKAYEPLEEALSFIQFANDECDYGMGLELGIDLFCHSEHFHELVTNLLPLAYELLNRPAFAKIIKEHLIKRK